MTGGMKIFFHYFFLLPFLESRFVHCLFGTSRMGSISNALTTPAAPNPYYSWLPSKGKLAIFTGVVAFVAGGFYLLRTSRVRVKKIDNARSRSRQGKDNLPPVPSLPEILIKFEMDADTSVSSNPDEEKSFRVILNLLRSSETAKQVNALQTLHQKSRLCTYKNPERLLISPVITG